MTCYVKSKLLESETVTEVYLHRLVFHIAFKTIMDAPNSLEICLIHIFILEQTILTFSLYNDIRQIKWHNFICHFARISPILNNIGPTKQVNIMQPYFLLTIPTFIISAFCNKRLHLTEQIKIDARPCPVDVVRDIRQRGQGHGQLMRNKRRK